MKVVIVEDDERESDRLSGYVSKYASGRGETADITVYPNALVFLSRYAPGADVVFMDIDMPDMTGMEAAKHLRERDSLVPLVFVTALSSFAVEGYSVGASDFLVKPYPYDALVFSLDKLFRRTAYCGEVTVRNMDGYIRIPVDSIFYVEVNRHRLLYHTDSGIYDVWGSMRTAESALPAGSFARCGVSYLVNLRNVTEVAGDDVKVGGSVIKISRAKKRSFMSALNAYIYDGGARK